MDVLETPLNSAHQQSRKAERCVSAGKFDDAIKCHQKAAEYLTEALSATTVQPALESLSLQRDVHLKQQTILRQKQRAAIFAEKQASIQRSRMAASASSTSQHHVQGPVPASPNRDNGQSAQLNDAMLIYQTMGECDSLLQFLNNRAASGGKSINPIPVVGRGSRRKGLNVAGIKVPKEDKEIIEELRVHSEALQAHIVDLLKEAEDSQQQLDYYQRELDHYRSENQELRKRIQTAEKPCNIGMADSVEPEERLFTFAGGMSLEELASLDLPPLEMPKFDFDVLKNTQENKEGSGELP